ncbi:hypothetical protein [Effusibacillus dendaii]|uniref:Uncharacterized protein n=1 Tax=Effusibacillus dendaii TaxID=2743772 RepID=A0A7I8D5U6_9BACL|nr:hypothetical protein [Effusibacillus dendaii]BCJ85523.1 hypothetical protein skT53_05080 [Effusibacillus dendaii]
MSEIAKEEVVTRYLEKWADTAGDSPFFFYGEENRLFTPIESLTG